MVEREAGRRSEMKNAGLGTGMTGGNKVLWDQVLPTGGTSANSGWVRSQVMRAPARPAARRKTFQYS